MAESKQDLKIWDSRRGEVQQQYLWQPSNDTELSDCTVARTRNKRLVDTLVRNWHSTLPNPPPGWRLAFIVLDGNDVPLAVATWGRPVARMEDYEETLELTRQAHSDNAPFNTGSWFLARMRKYIRKHMPEIKRLISYQDADNHHGTIYKADNWNLVYEKFTEHTWKSRAGRRGTERQHKKKWERRV